MPAGITAKQRRLPEDRSMRGIRASAKFGITLALAVALWRLPGRAFTGPPRLDQPGQHLLMESSSQALTQRLAAAGSTVIDAPATDIDASAAEITGVASDISAGDALPAMEERPGFTDREAFEEGSSVKFWQDFDPETSNPLEGVDLLGEDTPYWLYHLGRTGFFMTQGIAGVGWAALSGGSGSDGKSVVPRFLEGAMTSPTAFLKLIGGNAAGVYAQDLKYIKEGHFKKPYDMMPRHRQFSPAFVLDQGLRYVSESAKTLQRSARKDSTEVWVDSDDALYPAYYRHTFHYQSDGWLSSESAGIYETSTETLFSGRQDSMQRTTLVHLSKYFQNAGFPADGRGTRLLEIACGTGRVMTFMRDNWPGMAVTASDLSPFYLEEARKNNAYWEREFAPPSTALGKASFVQANAEALPFAEGSFDAIVSVYLFHELPAEAQDAVFAEVSRVLAPGGIFVLTDSIQLGDRPRQDGVQGRFGDFAEPYYQAYIRRDLASLARAHGLEPQAKELSSATKSVSFFKPQEVDSEAMP
mmetsp:Transcript_3956/g.9254  ORF Transcript_3956/g.9254 Transcript_3956/m.9254 type:complete len:528 (-) Transcript_3956:369-1952(-)